MTYSSKHAAQSLPDNFSMYFKHKSKSTGHLQFYYTPNDFLVTKDASFHVESSNHLQPTNYRRLGNFVIKNLQQSPSAMTIKPVRYFFDEKIGMNCVITILFTYQEVR